MQKIWKRIGIISLCVVVSLILVAGGYLIYLFADYSRIEDNIPIDIVRPESISPGEEGKMLPQPDTTYTAVIQNIGFGAYTQDFTFFMDGGTQSWAKSADSVRNVLRQAVDTVSEYDPDILLFQEVDTDSTRSHHVNQQKLLCQYYPLYYSTFAVNYHSSYLFYPFYQPHGTSNSGILTLSRFPLTTAFRRSLPISDSFSKFLDLDRCYSVSRTPTANGKALVVYNVHLSAYGSDDTIRTAQIQMLFADVLAQYQKGNYCIVGGDFNHDFTGNSTQMLNEGAEVTFGWAQPFPSSLLPEGISRCIDYKGELVPTCRNCDVPYEIGNFTIIVDGFLVSDNIKVNSVQNISTDFVYSDHNPVVLQFELMDEEA